MLTVLVPPGEVLTIRGTALPTLRWHVGPVLHKEVSVPIEVTLTTEEQCRLLVTPLTPAGNPAPVEGAAQWSVAGTSCTVQSIDATSAWVISTTTIGDSTITVGCDADLGAGVVTIADTCLVHVGNPMAAQLGLAADAPVLKPA
jgi:hypothetical protein